MMARENRGIRDAREAQFAQQNLITPHLIYNKPSSAHGKNSHHQASNKPQKLLEKYTNMDIKLIQAVQQPNSQFRVEHFSVLSEPSAVSVNDLMPASKIVRASTREVHDSIKSQKIQFRKSTDDDEEVKVESVGMTSADQPFPDYSAYFPRQIYTQDASGEETTLILEPSSKAVSGNQGTSISAPLSHALLRRGVPVRVLFKPESVAISGVGGTSHAQADLILDFINE